MDKWLVFIATCLQRFLYYGALKSNGVILDETVDRLDTYNAVVAGAFALQSGISFTMSPVTGALLDLFGYRETVVTGGLIAAASYFVFGIGLDSVWQLYAAYGCSGFGFGLMNVSLYLSLQLHFEDRFPVMFSLASVFNFIGIAAVPLVFQYMRENYGFSGAFILLGALLLNLVVSGVCLRTPPPHRGKEAGSSTPDENCLEGRPKSNESTSGDLFSLSPLYHHRLSSIVILLESIGFYVFSSWAIFLVSVGKSQGLSAEDSVLLSTAGGCGGFLGKLAAVLLFHSDKMTPYTAVVIPMAVFGLSLLGCTIRSNFYELMVFTLIAGACHGIYSSGVTGLLPSTVCREHFKQIAVISYTTDGVAFQLGGLISGFLYDIFGSPLYVFGVDSIVCFCAIPLALHWALSDKTVKQCQSDI